MRRGVALLALAPFALGVLAVFVALVVGAFRKPDPKKMADALQYAAQRRRERAESYDGGLYDWDR